MALLKDLKPGAIAKSYRGPWRGMAPDIDPQDLPPDRPTYIVNHRLDGNTWVLRGGQTLIVNIGGKVTGLHDHRIGSARPIFMVMNGCPGLNPGGYSLGLWDQEFLGSVDSPNGYLNVTRYAATYAVMAGIFGTDLYFGVDADLKRFRYGDKVTAGNDAIQETRITIPSGYVGISAIIETNGTLLIACIGAAAAGVGTSAVFTFDGLTFTRVLSAVDIVRGFVLWRDQAIAIFDGVTTNSVRIRPSSGTWSGAIAPSAGTVAVVRSNVGASYKDKAYWGTGTQNCYSYDGTTLQQLPIATTGVDAGGKVIAFSVFNGYLFFAWHNAASTAVFIGRFDGTTWVPKHKSLTAQASWPGNGGSPTLYPPLEAQSLKQYRGSLVLAAKQTPNPPAIYFSPREATTGTWTRLMPDPASSNGDIRELLVY
jgi:hypothetical protein